MPPAKEVPFFTDDQAFSQGLESYLAAHFKNAPETSLWGKATPHYLSDSRASTRIARELPKVKLIAILRDPSERALSHYRMSVRRGIEHRPFDQAVEQQLKHEQLSAARQLPVGRSSETETYLVWGEYGRLLQPYFDKFSPGNILVLFTSELENDPKRTLDKTVAFLQVDTPHASTLLGKRFHEGGSRERLPWVRALAQVNLIRRIWHTVPKRWRSPATYWFHQYNIVKEQDSLANYNPQTIQRLKDHYREDGRRLCRLLNCEIPWASHS
jgi:hypothetical protein